MWTEDAARLYVADYDLALKMGKHTQALVAKARERGLIVDEQSFGWGFAEGLTFMVEHPELAGYYVAFMKKTLGPRLRDLAPD